MNTDDLIENLAQGLKPIQPLWRPGRRAAAWSLAAAFYVGILVVAMSVATAGTEGVGAGFWVSQLAAAAMGLLASRAAFVSVIPGSSRRAWVWALLAAVIWLGTLAFASPWDFDWSTVAGATHEWLCVGFIVIGGAPLMAALVAMLRRGAPLTPGASAAFAVLAVAGLANVGACLSLPHTNSAVTLVWHGGVVLVLVLVASLAGHFVFKWSAAGPAGRRS